MPHLNVIGTGFFGPEVCPKDPLTLDTPDKPTSASVVDEILSRNCARGSIHDTGMHQNSYYRCEMITGNRLLVFRSCTILISNIDFNVLC